MTRESAESSIPTPECAERGTAVLDSTSDADDEVRAWCAASSARWRGRAAQRMAVVIGNNEPCARAAARPPRAGRHRAQRRLGADARRLRARLRGLLRHCWRYPITSSAATTCSRCSQAFPSSTGAASQVPAIRGNGLSREREIVRRPRASGTRAWRVHCRVIVRGRRRSVRWVGASAVRCARLRSASSRARRTIWTTRRARGRAGTLDARARARWIGSQPPRPLVRLRAGSGARESTRSIDRLGRLGAGRGRRRRSRCSARSLRWSSARARPGQPPRRRRARRARRQLALGVELDRLWVCGLAEGRVPVAARRRSAARRLRPPGARRRAPATSRPDRRRPARRSRAPSRDHGRPRTCSASAATCGRNTEHVPSRFLLDTIEALTGRREIDAAIERREVVHVPCRRTSPDSRTRRSPPTRHEARRAPRARRDLRRIAAVPEGRVARRS